ncbi:polymerase [Anopheles A virus]|uniref:RNA-directed RNA polymerase L n=1 Tax=Anopheles A virus TaxID=35307 RepID=A0A291NVX5_9VIRU|nr:polymerase [Anopheles A virus]ATJ04174.1 polymerase [Anopheles A virus]
MELALKREFRARINAANTADVAKDIDVDLYLARHNYFGKCVCDFYNIQYRDDVPLVDILIDCIDDFDPMGFKIPNITPDNYVYSHGRIFLIDYKVTLSMETVNLTIQKYTAAINEIQHQIITPIEVVIIQINPRTREIYISNDLFREIYGLPQIDVNFDDFFELKDILYAKFENDDEFLLKIAHGDFTLTAPWISDDTPELFEHDEFKLFVDSMPKVYQDLFDEALNFNSYASERWNTLLYKIREVTKAEYNIQVSNMSKNVFLCDGKYSKPSKEAIESGWKTMTERIKNSRNVMDSHVYQKPSIHFLWTEPTGTKDTTTVSKILRLSKSLQNANGNHPMMFPIRQLGQAMDFSNDIELYVTETNKRKNEARKNLGQVKNKKLGPFVAGDAEVIWEQQFVLSQKNITIDNRKRLLKEFAGIGKHKTFSQKTIDDIDISRPKILDFNNEQIYLESIRMMSSTKKILSKTKNYTSKSEFILDNYGSEIFESNPETYDTIEKITNTHYWSFVNDYSTLMRNMLAMSQYNRPNTFRVATCANDNLFGILLPSSDIKSKQSTIVYFIICIHQEEENLVNPGSKCYTFKSGNHHVTISKAMRLDKQRCQRIVSGPGLFLMSSVLMYNNNPVLEINDVLNFCLYTSLSVTKAMLSLTEPSRYMIMNSLALSSDVQGYIGEKFSPYTKTLFSVYMTRLIKNACYQAYNQREKVSFRDIYLTDFEITQKGVRENRDLQSIWFKGNVTLKEYLNQIFMPFYFNSKGLHEKHHVMIDLIKTVGEIEIEQRNMLTEYWSNDPKPQTVNLPIYLHCLSRSLITDTSRHNHLRNKVESRNNFKRSPTTISTFTSSKSSVKIGNFEDLKTNQKKSKESIREKQKIRMANPLFFEEDDIDASIEHANYTMLKKSIPNFIDYVTTKNFDRLYELYQDGIIQNETTIEICMKLMKTHKSHNFAIFNKGQKTAKDREIFEPEWETKAGMYVIERLSKERCKLNLDEMISEPGDGKLKILENKCESEIRYMLSKQVELQSKSELDNYRSTKIEINADMTKWSAQDVFVKYFWLIAMDPILYPVEKKRILYFMCNYLNKNLIIPDEVMYSLMDQKAFRENDIFFELTENFTKNHFQVKRNWLQGNYNYTSSYVHSCAMMFFKDVMKETSKLLQGDCNTNSLVHSDDNQTSIVFVQNVVSDEILIDHTVSTFKKTCLLFGCQANMKKTYFTNFIKEFVSLFNIMGEPFSIYGRFLLTSVGDCAYIGPYEDLSSRISAIQSSIKHGCPPSYAWLGIGMAHWMTYLTYNMLPGQKNDPIPHMPYKTRDQLPIELFGLLKAPLHVISMLGMESQNTSFLVKLLQKMNSVLKKKDPIISQINQIDEWDLSLLSESETINLKILRHIHLDSDQTNDTMGETSEMRSRSLLTPRKFTTAGVIKKLRSFCDYQNIMISKEKTIELLDYIVRRPELAITKGETKEEFINMTVFRYNSKRFKESLSIQNPSQLFIEQILFSGKPVIDYEHLAEKFLTLSDSHAGQDPKTTITGRFTFTEAYYRLIQDINKLPLTKEDIKIVYNYCISNDPLIVTISNAMVLSTLGSQLPKVGISANSMPEFRSMKLIHHSPALVLRAYSQGTPDIQGSNIEEMERDLVHLRQFIEETKLLEKMNNSIDSLDFTDEVQEKMIRIREQTKFYQICYEYIRSADHKVKVFILPTKTRTAHDFCSVIQGSLIKDNKWFSMHYLKQVVVQGHKAIITKTESTDYTIAVECFRVLFFFIDSFIAGDFKRAVLSEVIKEYTYKNMPIDDLLTIILRSQNRYEFLPLLYQTGYLTQLDLDKYDAMKSSERITWNQNQVSREFDKGPIDLQITGYNRELRIIGNDNLLTIAELKLSNSRYENIMNAGRKLLSCRHGMRFEKMQKIDIEPGNMYITYQRKTHNQYTYQIHSFNSIMQRNEDNKNKGRFFNEIIPVCQVIVSQFQSVGKLKMSRLQFLNDENNSISRLQISPNEQAVMRRANLDKCRMFHGPDINIGLISLNKLMQCSELMTLDYTRIASLSLVSIARILDCTGQIDDKTDDFEFTGLSNDPLEIECLEDIETSPMLKLCTYKQGTSKMTYSNAIKESLYREVNKFIIAFDLASDGYYSKKNLGILSTIVSTAEMLDTNEWSTLIKDCIHLTLIVNGMDAIYHTFSMPCAFLLDPINEIVNWVKLKSFIMSLPDVIDPMWAEMFNHFKSKAILLIDSKINQPINYQSILSEIEIEGGKIEYEFS